MKNKIIISILGLVFLFSCSDITHSDNEGDRVINYSYKIIEDHSGAFLFFDPDGNEVKDCGEFSFFHYLTMAYNIPKESNIYLFTDSTKRSG